MPEPIEPNYMESSVAGKKWRRAYHGEFSNPFKGVAQIGFDWEDRTALNDGSTFGTPAGSTTRYFTDPSATLEIRNPETGEATGQVITHGGLYAILWSLAMESARMQDEADAQAARAAESNAQPADEG